MDERFEPGIRGFDLACHVRELEADDRVVDEFLAEGAALVGVFYGFFVADAGEADALDDDADSFVVEVCHDDCEMLVFILWLGEGGRNTFEALVLFPDQVLDGHFDVFECDVCRA